LGFARGVGAAFHVLARSFAGSGWRVADESGQTLALETARRVAADGRRTARTGGRLALVHVDAGRSLRSETVAAEAHLIDALGVVDAIEIRLAQRSNVNLFASNIR